MKRVYHAGIILVLLLLFSLGLSVNVWADTFTEEVTLTEEERYNPDYYKPINAGQTGADRSRSKAQAASKDSFEDKIVEGLLNLEERIDVSEYQMQVEEFNTAYNQILNDHAELFFVTAAYYYSYDQQDGNVVSFQPTYIMTDKQHIQESIKKIEDAAEEAVSFITSDMRDYEKALVIHDWLAKYCEYDYDRVLSNSVPEISHTAYGAFVNKMAVCDGYAKAYAYIMQQKLGITCGVVSSEKMGHAWNMIQIGTNYYHVDVTWDDPTWDCIGMAKHEYFLLSDNTIKNEREEAHIGWESSVKAEDTSYENGYWVNSDSGVIAYDGTWYYIDNEEMKLKKTDNLLNGVLEDCYTFDRWYISSTSYYPGAYSYLWLYRNKLIFNGAQEIYSMSLATGEVTSIYEPAGIPSGSNIYGFRLDGDTMQYAIQTAPNLSQAQKSFIQTAPLPGENITGEIVIEGTLRYGSTLTAKVTSQTELTGAATYQWYSDGQLIAGETSSTYQLTGADIGKVITVKVTYKDYIGELVQSTATIQKAIPAQPSELSVYEGNYGETLSTIPLPNGYVWKVPDTVMNQAGVHSYAVLYTPDEALYETIEFEISVEVFATQPCEIHNWDEGVETTEPSCTTAGIITYTCQKCGTIKTEEIPATGHKNTELRNQKAATCSEAGYNGDTYCADCGLKLETGTVIAATGEHTWDAGRIKTAATCTQSGTKEFTCSVCKTVKTESIPATGHMHTEIRNKRSATATETGYTGDTYCIDCGTKLASGTVIAVTVQAPKKGTILKSGKIYYKVTKSGTKNGTVALYKISGTMKTLTIPATVKINGITYKVTSIAEKALMNNKKITQAVLGKNITSVGKSAFSGCTNLKKITIKSSSLKSVGANAFKNIYKKAAIKCPSKKVSAYKKLFTTKTGYKKKTMKISK